MKKRITLSILGILIIGAGIFFYVATKPLPAKAPGTADASGLSGTTYIEHATYYDITVNYASSTPLLAKVGAAANTSAVVAMKKFASDTITQFKTDGNFTHLTPADVKTMGFGDGRKEKLQIVYMIASSPRTISYIDMIYEDTLGAHGNTFFKTFTFDTTTGASLTLADIFLPGSDYLSNLSQISRAKLPGIIGDGAQVDMIAEGTKPEAASFSNFFFDGKEFVVLFSPYEVAAYAAGPQTLRIPLSDLTSILKPEYR